jgi:2-polyprenyl-6-methoxyphenol hydroxylase-like FAD-dependent oxidoreductase
MALVDALALSAAITQAATLPDAFASYEATRRAHLAAYHRFSRWLTPLFQSDHDVLARVRDAAFLPMARLPFARGNMLRVLAGTQQGWWGRHRLDDGFMAALQGALACEAKTA